MIKIDCVVKEDCLTVTQKRGVCRKCERHNKFKSVLADKNVKQGASNKRAGKKSEKKLLLHLQRQGLEARIIEGSGCLKKIKSDADADLRVVIKGKERKIENKKRTSFERIRKLIGDTKILYITNFCYIMNENLFYKIVKDDFRFPIREVSDRNYTELHKFFEQDNSDIVSLDESYKDFMFALTPELFEEITK